MNDKDRRLEWLERSLQPESRPLGYRLREVEDGLTPEERSRYHDELSRLVELDAMTPVEDVLRQFPMVAKVCRLLDESS
jgi:hypothetical protein